MICQSCFVLIHQYQSLSIVVDSHLLKIVGRRRRQHRFEVKSIVPTHTHTLSMDVVNMFKRYAQRYCVSQIKAVLFVCFFSWPFSFAIVYVLYVRGKCFIPSVCVCVCFFFCCSSFRLNPQSVYRRAFCSACMWFAWVNLSFSLSLRNDKVTINNTFRLFFFRHVFGATFCVFFASFFFVCFSGSPHEPKFTSQPYRLWFRHVRGWATDVNKWTIKADLSSYDFGWKI